MRNDPPLQFDHSISGHTPREDALRRELARAIRNAGGCITFERYMEMALYHPELGYYSQRPVIGRQGDFFTSVSVGPLFGRLLACVLLRLRAESENPADFQVLEGGGHRGQLRDDILGAGADLDYSILESGDAFPARISGVIISNELLDALPVHRVRVAEGTWHEVYVEDRSGDGSILSEVAGPLSNSRLRDRLALLPAALMEGYRAEVNLRAEEWLARAAASLERGHIITIDYGFERHALYAPCRRYGTLRCYRRHRYSPDPYTHVGAQDMTAHVDFTALIETGLRCGLQMVQFCDQSRFLGQACEQMLAPDSPIAPPDGSRWHHELTQLTHPQHMGHAFSVLVQRKRGSSGSCGGPCAPSREHRG